MTTIAARDGVIAADSVETDEDMIVTRRCRKVFRVRDGDICAFSGSSEQAHALLMAMKKGLQLPRLDNCCGVMFDAKGGMWLFEGIMWRKFKLPFYALGTGAYFAYAAMKAGADAIKAAKIGAELDPNSGGRVHYLKVSPSPRHRVKRAP